MQRYNHFQNYQNIFFEKESPSTPSRCISASYTRKKFSFPQVKRQKPLSQNGKQHSENTRISPRLEYKQQIFTQYAAIQWFNMIFRVFQARTYPLSTTYLLPINYHRSSIVLRYFFDSSSIVLRYFFDSSSIVLRFKSKYYRRTIEEVSKICRCWYGSDTDLAPCY